MTEAKKTQKNVSPKELATLCAQIADDRKAENIVTLEVSQLSVVADYFILCTGNSDPHLKAISSRIARDVREKLGARPRAIEGTVESHWILVDYGTVIVHIMTPESRDLYQLESLWGDAPKEEDLQKLSEASPE